MTNKLGKQISVLGVLVVVAGITLSGCGNGNQNSSQSSSTSSSATTSSTSNASTKAVKAAKQLIASGNYEKALTTLQDVASPSAKVNNLISEVKKLIQAESDYKTGRYTSAESSTATLKQSSNDEVSQAANDLAGQIKTAKNSDSTTSSSTSSATTSSTSSNSRAVTNSSSSTTTTTTDEDDNSVIAKFASAIGYYGKSGYGFTITSQSGQNYTIEVRQDNEAGDVANLIGIYHYNSSTGAVSKVN